MILTDALIIFSLSWWIQIECAENSWNYVFEYDYNSEDISFDGGCHIEEVKCNTLICGTVTPFDYEDPSATVQYYLTCRNVSLTAGKHLDIIQNANNFKYIVFENSTIPLVPFGVFVSFTGLTELFINDSSVQDIHPGAFTGLVKLKELYLQNNKIHKLSQGLFNSLLDLKVLDLSNNGLEAIEKHTFLGLFALERLYLNKNKLKHSMPAFRKLTGLKHLDLSENLFVNLNLSLELQHIEHVDLTNNNLITINAAHPTLTFLKVSKNKIKELNNSVLNQSLSLVTFDISHNLLEKLDADVFLNLVSLTELFLENNNLSHIPIGCFRNLHALKTLKLSGNRVSKIQFGTFSGLYNLETLDVSNNKLTHLLERPLHILKNLQVLIIAGNFITSVDVRYLVNHSRNLTTVDLNDNPWNCSSLLDVYDDFDFFNVTVVAGLTEKSTHIYGIACFDQENKEIEDAILSSSLEEGNSTLVPWN